MERRAFVPRVREHIERFEIVRYLGRPNRKVIGRRRGCANPRKREAEQKNSKTESRLESEKKKRTRKIKIKEKSASRPATGQRFKNTKERK